MRPQPQQQPQSLSDQLRTFTSRVNVVSGALALPLEASLHQPSTFGLRYVGPQALLAALIIGLFPACFSGCDPTATWWFLIGYIGMLVAIRIATLARRARGGPQMHSYYSGTPVLMRLFRRVPETSVKLVVEPTLVGLTGLVVQEYDRPLGTYLVVAAVGLFISVGMAINVARKRALDMHDAFVEQRQVTDRFRDLRGD